MTSTRQDRLRLAKDPNTDGETLDSIAIDADLASEQDALMRVARHPNTEAYTLGYLALAADRLVAGAAMCNPNADELVFSAGRRNPSLPAIPTAKNEERGRSSFWRRLFM